MSTEGSFQQQGDQALAYAKRHATELSLVRFDIDHFAEVFVKHGKDIAEQILSRVASLINEGKRTEDIAARLGVSRFALLLPSSDPQGAEAVVSRICKRVARLKLKMGKDIFNIQFSSGITSPSLDDSDIEFTELLSQAESALKIAINNGGGKIIRYQTGEGIGLVIPKTPAAANVEVNLETLVTQLVQEDGNVTDEQLASAMRKILPLITKADSNLKLGLSKVVSHLKKTSASLIYQAE